jgi:hypothetical protein
MYAQPSAETLDRLAVMARRHLIYDERADPYETLLPPYGFRFPSREIASLWAIQGITHIAGRHSLDRLRRLALRRQEGQVRREGKA